MLQERRAISNNFVSEFENGASGLAAAATDSAPAGGG